MGLIGKKATLFYGIIALALNQGASLARASESLDNVPSVKNLPPKSFQEFFPQKIKLTREQIKFDLDQFLEDQQSFLGRLEREKQDGYIRVWEEILLSRCSSLEKVKEMLWCMQKIYTKIQDIKDKTDKIDALARDDYGDFEDFLDGNLERQLIKKDFKKNKRKFKLKFEILKFIAPLASDDRKIITEQYLQILQKIPQDLLDNDLSLLQEDLPFARYLLNKKSCKREEMLDIIHLLFEVPELFKNIPQRIYKDRESFDSDFTIENVLDALLRVKFHYRWMFLEQFFRFKEKIPEQFSQKILTLLFNLDPQHYKPLTDFILASPERYELLCNQFSHPYFLQSLSKVSPEDRDYVLNEFRAFSAIVHPKDWEKILQKIVNLKFFEKESVSGQILSSFPKELIFPPLDFSDKYFLEKEIVNLDTIKKLLKIYAESTNLQEFKDFLKYVSIVNKIANKNQKSWKYSRIIQIFKEFKGKDFNLLINNFEKLDNFYPDLSFSVLDLIFSDFSGHYREIIEYINIKPSTKNSPLSTKKELKELLGYFLDIGEEDLTFFLEFLKTNQIESLKTIKKLSKISKDQWENKFESIKADQEGSGLFSTKHSTTSSDSD